MPKVLIETRLNSLKLNESYKPRKGCLGRMEGICADYANPTRNGRFYSRKLWEKVFDNDLIKESLESKTLIGELDHPEDRFEPLAKEACVVMTDYKFDDDNQVVLGGFDILDTPAGRILKSLLDYGCVMGVSSRGQGDIVQNAEFEEVEPDTYEFACFDVVTTPAVASARQHVTEGIKTQKIKGLSDSIIEQVNGANTDAELDIICRVVESTDLSNIVSIKEAIRNKRKSIVEGKTISNKTEKDLHEAKKQIKILTKELSNQSSKTIAEVKELRSTASNLSAQVLAYKHREEKLIRTIESLQSQISEDKKIISDKRLEVAEGRKKVKSLEAEKDSLANSVHESMEKYYAILDNEKALKTQITESSRITKDLRKQLTEKDSRIVALEESIRTEKTNYSKVNTSLTESKRRLDNNAKLLESFRNYCIESVCNKYGIDSKMFKDNFKQNQSPEMIERQIVEHVERLDRYSSLPFASQSSPSQGTRILSESLKSNRTSPEDREMEKSQWFMETVAGVN